MRDPAQVAHICLTHLRVMFLPFERTNCICDANFFKRIKKAEKNFRRTMSCPNAKIFYTDEQNIISLLTHSKMTNCPF